MSVLIHPEVYLELSDYTKRKSAHKNTNTLLLLCGDRANAEATSTNAATNADITSATITSTMDVLLNTDGADNTIDTTYLLDRLRLLSSGGGGSGISRSIPGILLGLVIFRSIDSTLSLTAAESQHILQVLQHVNSEAVLVLSYSLDNSVPHVGLYEYASGKLRAVPFANTANKTEFASVSSILSASSASDGASRAVFSIEDLSNDLSQKKESLRLLNDEKLSPIQRYMDTLADKEHLTETDFANLQKVGNFVELMSNVDFAGDDDSDTLNSLMGLMQLNLVGDSNSGGGNLALFEANRRLIRKL